MVLDGGWAISQDIFIIDSDTPFPAHHIVTQASQS